MSVTEGIAASNVTNATLQSIGKGLDKRLYYAILKPKIDAAADTDYDDDVYYCDDLDCDCGGY